MQPGFLIAELLLDPPPGVVLILRVCVGLVGFIQIELIPIQRIWQSAALGRASPQPRNMLG